MSDEALALYECCGHCSDRHREHEHRNPCNFPPACIGKRRLSDDATPPLVAAPPVPPVVPDSDPFGPLSDEDRRRMREFGASGSGVVPDKPALAPRCTCTTKYVSDITGLFLHETVCPLSVPAVTDDEAATKVRAVALALAAVDGYDTYARQANEFITRLRSAGFLIVHHTKET